MIKKAVSKFVNKNISYVITHDNQEITVILKIFKDKYQNQSDDENIINTWIYDTILKKTKLKYRII